MMSFLEVLLGLSVFDLIPMALPSWCNIAFMRMGVKRSLLRDMKFEDGFFDRHPISVRLKDPWGGPKLAVARLAELVARDQHGLAFDQLDLMPPEVAGVYAWDEQEQFLPLLQRVSDKTVDFRDAVTFHYGTLPDATTRIAFEKSSALAVRAYWKNRAGDSWRDKVAKRPLVEQGFETGAVQRAGRHEAVVQQGCVLEIGSRLALSGIGFMTAGASAYAGIDLGAEPEDQGSGLAGEHPAKVPDWLSGALADGSYRVIHYGDVFQVPDLVMIHGADPGAEALGQTLSNLVAAHWPEATLICDDTGRHPAEPGEDTDHAVSGD